MVALPLIMALVIGISLSSSTAQLFDLQGAEPTSAASGNLTASHGESCVFDRCVIPLALYCNQYSARCQCFDYNAIRLVINGKTFDMDWDARRERCLGRTDALCANRRLPIRDELGETHQVEIRCKSSSTCQEFATGVPDPLKPFQFGKCV